MDYASVFKSKDRFAGMESESYRAALNVLYDYHYVLSCEKKLAAALKEPRYRRKREQVTEPSKSMLREVDRWEKRRMKGWRRHGRLTEDGRLKMRVP